MSKSTTKPATKPATKRWPLPVRPIAPAYDAELAFIVSCVKRGHTF